MSDNSYDTNSDPPRRARSISSPARLNGVIDDVNAGRRDHDDGAAA